MKQSAKKYRRIVIKVGSSILTKDAGLSAFDFVSSLANLITQEDRQIVIVSSGAIAMGMRAMDLKVRPKELSFLQAAAAIGQNALMDIYSKKFEPFKLKCAQVLLTWDDLANRKRYLNAKNTILKLLSLGVVPIVNENDTISTEEIKFGDNDRLSALVANLINADLLIILSDVQGLLDKNKNLVRVVTGITDTIKGLACPTDKQTCVGGMITKIEAAEVATKSGIPCIIARGQKGRVIADILHAPDGVGDWTIFIPLKGSMAARERWIAFGSKTKGAISVDEGAKRALLNKKSLLAVGVVKITGAFDSGDIVGVSDRSGSEFARGKVNISAKQLEKLKGERFAKEVIHRDNIVIL